MWWRVGGGGSGSGGGGLSSTFVRYFSRKCAVNLRKINPKVPLPEASVIAQGLWHVIKQNGPLSVSNTWTQAQEAGVSGLNSKTHLKLMLKWMQGRKMLKQSCNHIGSTKKFVLCTLPEDPQTERQESPAPKRQTKSKKPHLKKKKAKK